MGFGQLYYAWMNRWEISLPSRRSTIENTRGHILSCEMGFRELERVWRDCEQVASMAISKDLVRNLYRRAAFPFKKIRLQDTEDVMTGLQQNLDTALQALQV